MAAPSASRRSAVLPFVAAAGTVAILVTYNAHYPIRTWMLWRVLGYWALTLYFGCGCLAVGVAIVRWAAPRQYRPVETMVLGFALGVVAFAATVLVAGLVRLLGTPFFVTAPGVFVALGRRPLASVLRAWNARRRPLLASLTALEATCLALGVLGLVAIYVPILTPHNVQHDARWYHLPIAQQYASEGAVTPFPEGWLLGAYPHLASYLYTWAFLLPASIVHRLELCGHIEFLVFLFTLAAVPGLVRRITIGRAEPAAWVGFFLFPGFLVYDSNLSTGADHVAALFAAAGMIALYPALRTLSVRHAALVGACAAGALFTKYSAISIALPLLAFVVGRAVLHTKDTGKERPGTTATLAAVAAFLVVWSPHWLPNLLWYGDPVYPMLQDRLNDHPWDAQAAMYFRVFMDYAVMKPTRDLAGIAETLRAAGTLGFHAYETGFHGELPTFGFLFAATLYCLPFLRLSWRSLVAHGIGFSAAAVWYWTNHRDRYLQAPLPWFVVATVVVLSSMWRAPNKAVRASAAALVLAQLACGAGAYLAPSHFMIPGAHPLTRVTSMIDAGLKGRPGERVEPFKEWRFAAWTGLGAVLPKNARVLVHEDRLWIGLDRPVVVDEAQWQAGIRYGGLKTPAEVYDLLAGFGITHIVTGENHSDGGDHGLAGNLVFMEFVTTYAKRLASRDTLTLWQMPSERPKSPPMGAALILTCNQSEPGGFFEFAGIQSRRPLVEVAEKAPVPGALVDRATYVVLEDDCHYTLDKDDLGDFDELFKRRTVTFWRRKVTGN